MSNRELQQFFLDIIKEFAISNPEKEITDSFIYSNLMEFNVHNYQKPYQEIDNFFKDWILRYVDKPNIKVFEVETRPFLWFENGKLEGNEIKLYIPLDADHIKFGASIIFDFITDQNIHHQSKISKIVRNDDLVIRVNNLEDANKIINFVNSNSYIREGLIKVNPFLPNNNGIGMAMDNSYSFNSTVSQLIAGFVNYLKNTNQLQYLNVENLNYYIRNSMQNVNDPDLRDIYNLISMTTSENFNINNFYNFASYKSIDAYTEKRTRITDPSFYFERAVKTINKYSPGNEKIAILNYLKGMSYFFPDACNARGGIKKYVRPGDVISIMRSKLYEAGIDYPHSDDELIDKYLGIILKSKINDNFADFNIIKQAYISTLRKYDYNQARVALEELIKNNTVKYFTDSNGDRKKLKELLSKRSDIIEIILSNINIENLNPNDIGEIARRFFNAINVETQEKEHAM